MRTGGYDPGDQLSDELLARLAEQPLPDRSNATTCGFTQGRLILMARELLQARTSLRLIAASLPPDYAPSAHPHPVVADVAA